MLNADPSKVSSRAKKRGLPQVRGLVGSVVMSQTYLYKVHVNHWVESSEDLRLDLLQKLCINAHMKCYTVMSSCWICLLLL